MRSFDIPFEEIVVPMGEPESKAEMLRYAPTGKCPSLHDGEISVWDSLAIVEYLAERFPERAIWPKAPKARAVARSLCAEMHSGFQALRQALPTNFRRGVKARELTPEAEADVRRIEAAFAAARAEFGSGGPFLFGAFSAADAFFAPIVSRLTVYDVPMTAATRDYCAAVQDLAAWRRWHAEAAAEPWRIEKYEQI
jgi:glutathione S-transferase